MIELSVFGFILLCVLPWGIIATMVLGEKDEEDEDDVL